MAKFGDTGATLRANREAIARLAAQLDGVSEEGIRKADRRALASVRRRFEPTAKRILREQYNVRAGDLSGRFQVRTATDGNGGEVLQLWASTRKIPLIRFSGRWGGRLTPGATAEIIKGSRKTYVSAFRATWGGKDRLVARQFSADSNSPSGRHPREKLRTLMGPSPLQMVQGIDGGNAAKIVREMNQFRATEIIRQLQLARRGR